MRETNKLEFKEDLTNSFLKTVSAFANYDGGQVIFGIDDNGQTKGLTDLDEIRLSIENRINDSISPQPDYMISVQESDRTITLTVKRGINKPYLYKSKAYKRNDTATIEVDALEFSRLVLEGKNLHYECLPSKEQQLSFAILADRFRNRVGVQTFNQDTLKTLNLYSDDEGYNHAAEILADENQLPGVDLVVFGENINIIKRRLTSDCKSIICVYEDAVNMFRDYYEYEEIVGAERKSVERIPEAAFREAIANALIHRTWDVSAQIRVMMFEDRIELISPGGLTSGISEEEYLSGKISMLRNPIITNVFYRLHLVEAFGTGILRIKQMYASSATKPSFEVTPNAISVTLPITAEQPNITEEEKKIYHLLSKTVWKSISEITASAEFGKSKVTGLLKSMEKKGIVVIEGKGRGTKYHL